MIIGISGKIGSGKDTVAQIIQYLIVESQFVGPLTTTLEEFLGGTKTHCVNKFYADFDEDIAISSGWKIKKFADKLKFIAHVMTGYPLEDMYSQEGKMKFMPEWGMTIRDFQIKLGTEAVRDNIHFDGWILALFADYNPNENWMVTDVRFKNEFNFLEKKKALKLRVERPGIKTINHISETDLDNWIDLFDEVIVNDGTLADLSKKIKTILIKHGIIKTS